jgi:hypothetical protein
MAITKIQSESLNLSDNYDFTGTVTGAGGVNTPAFHAYLGSSQAVPSMTFTKIQFNTKVFDNSNAYDNTTNYRYTPQTAGKYFFYSKVFSGGAGNGGNVHSQLVTTIRKNGSDAAYSNLFFNNLTSGVDGSMKALIVLEMNGSTDYVETFHYSRNNNSFSAFGGAESSYFGGYKIIE